MTKSILIIDDDQYLRDLYEEVLKDEGYSVTCAEEGYSGLDKIAKNKYDLILLDIMMPKLDGIGVLKEIKDRKLEKNVAKIVLLTNLAHGPVIEEANKYGARDYLIKADLTPDQIVKKIKGYIS